jgi:mannose-6-phosphate isomerase-like protein (cupin superfamily)
VKTVQLAEIEPTRIGDVLWKPIRSELGVEAFGINAYVAHHAGDPLFDEHDETEGGAGTQRHEELYLVVSGRATFTADAREVNAPAGTIVFFKDPAERRAARAAEPNTTVIAIGAPVGEGYEVAPWEYWFRAKRARDRGHADEARVIAEEGLSRHPSDSRLQRLVR